MIAAADRLDGAAFDADHAVGHRRKGRVMRDDDDRQARLTALPLQ